MKRTFIFFGIFFVAFVAVQSVIASFTMEAVRAGRVYHLVFAGQALLCAGYVILSHRTHRASRAVPATEKTATEGTASIASEEPLAKKPIPRDFLLPALLAIPAFFAADLVNALVILPLQALGYRYTLPMSAPGTVPELLASIAVFALIPGFCEELFFRKGVLGAFTKAGAKRPILLTTTLFAIFHVSPGNLAGPLSLGLLFGLYARRSGSFLPAALAHFLNNAIAMCWLYLGDPLNLDGTTLITAREIIILCAIGLPAIAAIVTIVANAGTVTRTAKRG
jgi:membrane protease YdiL (CAAX protease family)